MYGAPVCTGIWRSRKVFPFETIREAVITHSFVVMHVNKRWEDVSNSVSCIRGWTDANRKETQEHGRIESPKRQVDFQAITVVMLAKYDPNTFCRLIGQQ